MNKENIYRSLTQNEVETLKQNGCQSESWSSIEVRDGFDSAAIERVHFSGEIRLGIFKEKLTDNYGIERKSGIRDSHLFNCMVGDNSLIDSVRGYIANMEIGQSVIIHNVDTIVGGDGTFGIGVEVSVLNENGGRKVKIYRGLSAQAAYIMANYRHRPRLIEALYRFAEVTKVGSIIGKIGDGAKIIGCGTLDGVAVGERAEIIAAASLRNGTIERDSYVGTSVIASDFIVCRAARVDTGARIERCYVGEGVTLDSGFVAEDSLFFANCHMANGEAVSVFAAPYSVSHHKSSLLIAGMFSFFNAGSGANQSNHLFKSGAVHQGVHERGCKFASNAYVMLPAREGAFSVVIGRHTSHHDTQDFPYSYLIEREGRTYLHPAANLATYGTQRDIEKWAKRDKRITGGIDRLNFEEHNPYIGAKMAKALELSEAMLEREGVESYTHNGVRIKATMLQRGVRLYTMGLDATLGAILSDPIAGGEVDARWVDLAGQYAPLSRVERVIERIEGGEIKNIEQLEEALDAIAKHYQADSSAWAESVVNNRGEKIEQVIERGRRAQQEIAAMRKADKERDFTTLMMVGYGIDARDEEQRIEDFNFVRGVKQ